MPVIDRRLVDRRGGAIEPSLGRGRASCGASRYDVALDLQGLHQVGGAGAQLRRAARGRVRVGLPARAARAAVLHRGVRAGRRAVTSCEKNLCAHSVRRSASRRRGAEFPIDEVDVGRGAAGRARRRAGATRCSTRARRGRTSAGRPTRFGGGGRAAARAARPDVGRAVGTGRGGARATRSWRRRAARPSLSPPTTIADLVALARGAALMVSGDTGPTHIAAAVGTPLVGIFGPTRPARNGPWSPRDVTRVARRRLPVPSPAALHAGRRCACSTSRWTKWSPRSSGGSRSGAWLRRRRS